MMPFALIPILLALAACAVSEPYVYKAQEFNRAAATFNVEPQTIDEVAICHNGSFTSFETLQAMADKRCGEFAKTARFWTTRWGDCPLATPAMAVFACRPAK